MAVTYCGRWNTLTDAPIDPMSEDEARARFDGGPWFTVVLDAEGGVPRATIEVQPGASVAKVFRYTASGSPEQSEVYRRQGDRLFMTQLDTWTYADSGKHQMREATVIDTFLFKPDGVVRRVTNDKSRPDIESEDRDGVDVEPNYRPVPAFGEWETLAREPA